MSEPGNWNVMDYEDGCFSIFAPEDCLLDGTGAVVARGDDPRWVAYRQEKDEAKRREREEVANR